MPLTVYSPLTNTVSNGLTRSRAGRRRALIGGVVIVSLGLPLAGRAEVWKCQIDGRVHYSDQPCQTASQGSQLAPRVLQGNVIEVGRPGLAALQDEPVMAPSPPASVCPSERDIASMETTASSTSLSAQAKRFVQDEIRRARQCRKGQGRYSAADWAISRDAVAAQSSLSGAEDARIRSEAMHSAADPAEGDRIARRQQAELRPALRGPRQAPAQPLTPPPAFPGGARCGAASPCP